ncbi:M48 family metallopeptidase [Thalassomonas viridans]|uniref:M48 family metallopeptidase n=1 Tax=Thalassomonas viridans TaxID=137584 RepID=A0AAE9Z1A2_9GAMM|nr:M48 family metallopeptidase [Thalassomonas viridans]WDE03368.1 M48 family metallopeptidase [Thalassomonas viridans]
MDHISIEGQLFPERSSGFEQVYAEFQACGTIVIFRQEDKQQILSASLAEVKLSDKLGNTPRQMVFPGGELFSFIASEAVDAWLHQRGSKSSLHAIEQSKKFILAALVLVPLMLVGLFKYVIPEIAVSFSSLVPQSAIEISSQHTLQALDKTVLSPSNFSEQEQQAYVDKWQNEIAALDYPHQQYQILLRQSDLYGANAFALPDGTIVVTDDLIELFSDHPDALFAILLHEMGHVEQHHAMRYIAETLATSIVVSYLFGDLSAVMDLFIGSGVTMIGNQFSQALEWEADNFAIAVLKKQGKSPESFADAMKLFLQQHGETDLDKLFSTHPLMAERAQNALAQK